MLAVLERSQVLDIRSLASSVLVRLTGSSSGAHLTSGQRSLQAESPAFPCSHHIWWQMHPATSLPSVPWCCACYS